MVTPNSRPEQMKPVLEQLRAVDGHDRRTQDADSNDDAAAPCTLQERTCTCEGPRAGERSSAVFGPFRLRATERLVEKDGLPMRLGGRALDILIALVERAPEVVSKRDLIKSVWGDLVVDEGNLRYHIVALRKALGDGRRGIRYIANVAGRGYCFVSPLSRSPDGPAIRGSDCIDHGSLPAPRLKLIGCDDVIQRVMIQLTAQRLVSLVGPGGIGKTAVAIQVAHGLLPEFDGDVYFVDLATLAPTASVSDALASTLGLTVDRGASLPDLLARLRERRLLLVFDNCEHVIEAVAELANQLFRAAPRIHILATSREHLRIEGERVIPVSPLGYPPASGGLTAAEALRFPAVQLFVQLVAANVHPFELSDAEAPIVCDLCRRLDGVPLALELAAGRVRIYGIRGIAALVGNACCLLWPGPRTKPLRHRTLYAALDWSYNLLSASERLALHRLCRIDGPFCLEAAAGDQVANAPLAEGLARLAEKSLVCVDVAANPPQYRLLEATRAYVAQKIAESGAALELEPHQALTAGSR